MSEEVVSQVGGHEVAQSVRIVDKANRLFPGAVIYSVDSFGSVIEVLFSGVLIGRSYESAKESWILENAERIRSLKDAGLEVKTFCDNTDGII